MVTDLSKTKQYLEQQYNPKDGQTVVAVAVLCLIALVMAIRMMANGGGSWLLIITFFGCGSTIAAGYARFVKRLKERARKLPRLRPDLEELGRELHELAESTSFERRFVPAVAQATERVSEAALATLSAIKHNGRQQSELAQEVEPGIHEAMHEVFSLALPFIRQTGTRKSHFAERVGSLDPGATVAQIDHITEKMTAVRIALVGSDSPTLRLDQTLQRIQELKVAESELDQSLSARG
jgi:hypothetical protein